MLIGYARINSKEQNHYNQLDALIHAGIDIRNIYLDKTDGAKSDGEKLRKMLEDLQEGDFVIITELTKLCKCTRELFEIIDKVGRKRANIKSLKEDWFDTSTSSGRLLYNIISGVAQFEKEIFNERTKVGLSDAESKGRMGGRPQKAQKDIDKAIKLYEDKKHSVKEIQELTGISKATLYRYLKQL
jgi:DNA invertase Pin-like site-specific DNA recombinase